MSETSERGSLTDPPTWDDVRVIARDTRYSDEFLGSVVRRVVATETCPGCGGDAGENWFDRSLCADDFMHTRCSNCGHALDGDCCG